MLKSVFDTGRNDGYFAAWRVIDKLENEATLDNVASGAEAVCAEKLEKFAEGGFFREAYRAGFELGVKEAIHDYSPFWKKLRAAQ